jgi:hypothetical protein
LIKELESCCLSKGQREQWAPSKSPNGWRHIGCKEGFLNIASGNQ